MGAKTQTLYPHYSGIHLYLFWSQKVTNGTINLGNPTVLQWAFSTKVGTKCQGTRLATAETYLSLKKQGLGAVTTTQKRKQDEEEKRHNTQEKSYQKDGRYRVCL